MGSLARFNVATLVARHKITQFVETGYGMGNSCRHALNSGMRHALSCELYEDLHRKAEQNERLYVAKSDSVDFLKSGRVQSAIAQQRCLIFLDAHFPGADFGGSTYNDASHSPSTRLPLIDELALLKGRAVNALILIDDVRIYRRDFQVAHGALPDSVAHGFDQEARFLALLGEFEATHALHWLAEDTGYAVLWPRAWGDYELSAWILPGDVTQPPVLHLNVPGTTCVSLNRRLQDARFSNRWLVGMGIDIGGGNDSIAVYAQLFPRIQTVTVYDMPQGDAQYLANVPDGAFDFLYSGHCLEHMVDPRIALRNWLRVVKPGGHLVITVPDEDLYEQGVWPSTFNYDHKHTFTMFKRTSWSPVSINVLDMLREFDGEVNVAKIERLDHAFLRGIERFDQTRTAFAECGIEFVVQKL